MVGRQSSGEPLYQQVKRALLDAISQGEYDPAEPFITQREVCERFGVSTTTAVRALNELVAQGILIRRRALGTFVAGPPDNPPVRSESQETTIACIVHGLRGGHVSEVLRGVESACAELGFWLYLSDTKEQPEREGEALRRAAEAGTSGVILYPVEAEPDRAAIDELRRRGIPLVMVDRFHPDLPTDAVLADNFAVGYRLTEELIAQGHHRIAILWSETRCTSVLDRLAGHTRALADHQLPTRPELTTLRSYMTLSEKQRRARLRSLLRSTEPPTALLCSNGYVLAAAAGDLVALGVDVPAEVDLAGMDDAGPFKLLPLAVVAAVLPSWEMGRRAVHRLVERLDSGEPFAAPEHIVLPIDVRTRDSGPAQLRAVSTKDVNAT
ncbi:LacI family DNA-binding transcriptional regulator [Actinopolymorpha alba]|uniref:LacI family DNA-binding transcriptional regulator n=1 Tax=Actinopolymorpha alba TaxID=533267 RepID=UPI00037DC0A7|nr:GntR family transcriptional regulator [Actinopolymorpha alba]